MQFYNDFFNVNFETPEEREWKRKAARRTFSRVFLALFLYVVTSQVVATAIYTIAAILLSPEAYYAFATNSIYTLLISSAVQYLIGFPIFILITLGMKNKSGTVKEKMRFKELMFLFFIGQTLMYIGNIIGNTINSVVGNYKGASPENPIETIVNETPLWLLFILVVIVGPIVEEIICRKIMIDKLSIFGDGVAILFSAVAFGMLHMNLYQFFYAAFLGVLLGYIYAKTRNVKYTIVIHMIVNFIGSIVALPVQKALEKLSEYSSSFNFNDLTDLQNIKIPPIENLPDFVFNGGIVLLYQALQLGMVYSGLVVAIYYFRRRKFTLSREKDISLKIGDVLQSGIVNAGSILYICTVSILTIITLFFA